LHVFAFAERATNNDGDVRVGNVESFVEDPG